MSASSGSASASSARPKSLPRISSTEPDAKEPEPELETAERKTELIRG